MHFVCSRVFNWIAIGCWKFRANNLENTVDILSKQIYDLEFYGTEYFLSFYRFHSSLAFLWPIAVKCCSAHSGWSSPNSGTCFGSSCSAWCSSPDVTRRCIISGWRGKRSSLWQRGWKNGDIKIVHLSAEAFLTFTINLVFIVFLHFVIFFAMQWPRNNLTSPLFPSVRWKKDVRTHSFSPLTWL